MSDYYCTPAAAVVRMPHSCYRTVARGRRQAASSAIAPRAGDHDPSSIPADPRKPQQNEGIGSRCAPGADLQAGMLSGNQKGRHILYLIGLRPSNRINDLACGHTNPRVYPLDVVVSGRPTMPGQHRSAAVGSSASRLSRTGGLGRLRARAVRIVARCQRYTKVGGRGRGGGNGRVGARFTYSPARV